MSMCISFEVCIKLAQLELDNKDTSTFKLLSTAKEIYLKNNDSYIGFPLSEADINLQGILDDIKPSEREADLIYLFQFFNGCYNDLNMKLLSMLEFLSDLEKERLLNVYDKLHKFGCQQYLFNPELISPLPNRELFIKIINREV